MTPSELDSYLVVLKSRGVQSAHVALPGGAALQVVFAPEVPDFGDSPLPGAWKSPMNLDRFEDLNPPEADK